MSDSAGVQYIAELDFDTSPVKKTFEQLNEMVRQESLTLTEMFKSGFNLNKVFENRAANGNATAANILKNSDALKMYSAAFEDAGVSAETFKKKQDALNEGLAKSKIKFLDATTAVKDAEKAYKKLGDETSKSSLEKAIVEQQKAKQAVKEFEDSLKTVTKEAKAYDEIMRRAANGDTMAAGVKKANEALKEQSGLIENVEKKQDSLLTKSGKWFTAYQVWHLLKKTMSETVDTMREVETVMMEISRVMELNTEQSNRLRDSLFGVSSEMAQTFRDTADISKRFAQAGYQEAAENIEMTRTALLAMNTAELDAVNSTDSMVGILKQWNLEGKDLITVIDKLNYAADNNAITTQDLVDALLRSSSAAKNAKFSFEETVGALVALKEATGRTGKELGTALNSLISFTQRDQSRKLFESLGVKVYADESKQALTPLLEQWGQLSDLVKRGGDDAVKALSTMDGMAELLTEDMAEVVGMQKEYNELFADGLTDMQKMDVFNQSGVFRKNYWIALLENFGKIQKVVDEMPNAVGHSMRENARYMETFDAKIKQLVTSLQELAVQAGEAGLLDVAKGAVTALTAVTNFTKGVGGLVPVMITLAGVLALIKKESVGGAYQDLATQTETSMTQMYETIIQSGYEWATRAIRDGEDVLAVYQRVVAAMREAENAKSAQSVYSGSTWDMLQIPSYVKGSRNYPQSHTGSLITKDGGFELEAGELVVRKDITKGLLNLVESFNAPTAQNLVVRPDIVENLMRSAKMMEEAPKIIEQLISNHAINNNTSNSKNVRIDMRGSQFGAGVGGQRIARDLDSAILDLLN